MRSAHVVTTTPPSAQEDDLRDQLIPPLLPKHKVNVRRPPAVAVQQLQQLADRPVVRDRIADGLDALEPEAALLVADHDAPLAGRVAVRVLHVVVALDFSHGQSNSDST